MNTLSEILEKSRPCLIYCKVEDISMDISGNIYIIISKHRSETQQETARKLREFIGKDCSIIISEMI